MDSIHFDETQVLIIDEKLNHDEVLKKMADQLQVKGYVKDSYYPAIIEREKIIQPDYSQKLLMLRFPIVI